MTKTLTLLLLCLASITSFAQSNNWKHSYFKIDNNTFRLSYIEDFTPPTYGMNQGGRAAKSLYLDTWGDFENVDITYKFEAISPVSGYVITSLKGTLIKDSSNHQYKKMGGFFDSVWLEGNGDVQHFVTISIHGQEHRVELYL